MRNLCDLLKYVFTGIFLDNESFSLKMDSQEAKLPRPFDFCLDVAVSSIMIIVFNQQLIPFYDKYY